MPIEGIKDSAVESSKKISYVLKMDQKPEIDPRTGETLIKPKIFCDSFMDDP